MSVRQNTKQEELGNSSKEVREPIAAARRMYGAKMPGTRAGTAEDWRAGGTKKTGEKSERGKRLRDGR
jgi:hypothetical protein